MSHTYSHLTHSDLEDILTLLAKSHPQAVEEAIAQQQREKVLPSVTRIEIDGDYLYLDLIPHYQEKLKQYLEENKSIRLDPCFDPCSFCKRYYGPTICAGDVEYDCQVDKELIDEMSDLNEDLEEKLIDYLDRSVSEEDEQ